MTKPMGVVHQSAAAPARIKVRTISSVAYATEERASEDSTASPVVFDRRSWCARCEGMGRPTRICLRDLIARPSGTPFLPFADEVS